MERPPARDQMNGTKTADSEEDAVSLEAMEVEFALGAIDVLIEGFDTALLKAAERVHGRVLFNMPALDKTTAQRIGAIAIDDRPHDQVIFVTLGKDGTSLTVGAPTGDNAVFESLGYNYAAVMKGLEPEKKRDE